MTKTALVVSAVVRDGKVSILDEGAYRTQATKAAAKWGSGTMLTLRIEPEDEARRREQDRFYFGYIVAPLVEYTGDAEMHLLIKAMFMPAEKRSLTDLSYDEMKEYIARAEAWARTTVPEAFDKHGYTYVPGEGRVRTAHIEGAA